MGFNPPHVSGQPGMSHVLPSTELGACASTGVPGTPGPSERRAWFASASKARRTSMAAAERAFSWQSAQRKTAYPESPAHTGEITSGWMSPHMMQVTLTGHPWRFGSHQGPW
jgi:hypothetical protein